MLKSIFKRKVEGLRELPTLPDSVTRIIEKIDAESSMAQISEIIEEDQVISARVLKLVNSAFYGMGGRVSSLHHAVSLLGVNVLRGLVLSSYFLTIDDSGIEGLWEHASAVSSLVYAMGNKLGFENCAEVTAAALLHDIGKLILREVMGEQFVEMQHYIEENRDETFKDKELSFFPVGHEDAALLWMKRWNFPALIQEVAAYHHRPAVSKVYKREVSLVHLADTVVKGYGYGFSGDYSLNSLNKVAVKHLKLKEDSLYQLVLDTLSVLD